MARGTGRRDVHMVAAFNDAVNVEELYRAHWRRVRWIVWRIVGNRQDADDITHSAFARLLESDGNQASVRNESAFLTTIATNLARNHLRHRNTVQKNSAAVAHHYRDILAAPEMQADSAAAHDEKRLESLGEAIAALPPKCRVAFVLCKLKGLTYQQTAERMGISIHMVKKHVQRGMARLAESLDNFPDGNAGTPGAANDVG